MEDYNIIKYPRTPHLSGSKLQDGDKDLSQVPFSEVLNKNIVIEEKIDGANTAISFNNKGNLLLQNRGHYLYGGYKERHYNLFKVWAINNQEQLYKILSDRYIMYGEWMYAKHKVFYDALPDYFMEFDIYDRINNVFLDTKARKELTNKLLFIHSVPVLGSGIYKNKDSILKLLTNSKYITENHLDHLQDIVKKQGLDYTSVLLETDSSMLMEGLYIKIEENGIVTNRVKFVRASYLQSTVETNISWQRKPIIQNQLSKTK